MSNKIIKTINLPKEQLVRILEDSEGERVRLMNENIRLEKDSKYWRAEAEKFERFWNDARIEQGFFKSN